MSENQFRKIKISDKGVALTYEQKDGDDVKTVVFSSEDQPTQQFSDAFQALKDTVKEICEFNPKYMEAVEVRGLSLVWKGKGEDKRLAATIHAVKKLSTSSRPLNINTPLLEEASEEAEGNHYLTETDLDRIWEVVNQAEAYLEGERAPKPEQLKLVS